VAECYSLGVITHQTNIEPMNTNLKKTVLDSRQFTGLLLVLFCIAALIIKFWPVDADTSWQSAKMQSEALMVQTFGFLLPPFQSLLTPVLGVITFLAILNFWLCLKRGSNHAA